MLSERGLLAEGADDMARIEPDFGKLPADEADPVDQRLRIAALGIDDEFERIEADVAMVAQRQRQAHALDEIAVVRR